MQSKDFYRVAWSSSLFIRLLASIVIVARYPPGDAMLWLSYALSASSSFEIVWVNIIQLKEKLSKIELRTLGRLALLLLALNGTAVFTGALKEFDVPRPLDYGLPALFFLFCVFAWWCLRGSRRAIH